jgi:hypothetical protein
VKDVPIREQITAVNEAIRDIDRELGRGVAIPTILAELKGRRHALECVLLTLRWVDQTVHLLAPPLLTALLALETEER